MTILSVDPIFIKERLIGSTAKLDGDSVICGAHLDGIQRLSGRISDIGLGVDVSKSNAVMVRLNTNSQRQAEELLTIVRSDVSIVGCPLLDQRVKTDGTGQLVLEFFYPEFLLIQSANTLTPQTERPKSRLQQRREEMTIQGAQETYEDRSMKDDHEGFIDMDDIDLDEDIEL